MHCEYLHVICMMITYMYAMCIDGTLHVHSSMSMHKGYSLGGNKHLNYN